jgi:D-3-phosphoglycerate dehydrogenase
MTPFQVLVTDRFELEALALLQGDSALKVAKSAEPQPTAAELVTIQGLAIRSRTRVDRDLLALAPKLEVVVTATSGFDHIDLDACEERGIKVMFTPEANAASAAELTWGLVLSCARKLNESHRAVKSGEWRRDSLMGRQLEGKTYGIVGLGRIGTRVARIAQAFGMRVIAFDPYKDDEHFEAVGAQRFGLEELFMLSDVVSLHVPASDETKGMIHRYLLDAANRSLILINTSRGSVVSEQDLVEGLTLGWIAAAGLDVFEREPLPRHSNLLNLPNVVMSPHLGATTGEAFARASWDAAEKIRNFAGSRQVSDPLPPLDPWWMAGFSKDSLRVPKVPQT